MTLLESDIQRLSMIEPKRVCGQVESVRGLMIRVADFPVGVDTAVEIQTGTGKIPGEVVGFDQGRALVMSLGRLEGIAPGNVVAMKTATQQVICSPLLVGRVIDALGNPLDGKGPIKLPERRLVNARS